MKTYDYITAIPIWKDNSRKQGLEGWSGHCSFVGDDSIVHKRFSDINSALNAMKDDGTCLREKNWEVRGYYGWFSILYHDISFFTLQQEGLLSDKIEEDSMGKIYKFKV